MFQYIKFNSTYSFFKRSSWDQSSLQKSTWDSSSQDRSSQDMSNMDRSIQDRSSQIIFKLIDFFTVSRRNYLTDQHFKNSGIIDACLRDFILRIMII